jgi:hypothetical protein
MGIDVGFEKIGDMLSNKRSVKPPAYLWQELALRVIKELGVPNFKRDSVFKACKEHPRAFVLTCLSDTKELCKTGERWKYFFKLIESKEDSDQGTVIRK